MRMRSSRSVYDTTRRRFERGEAHAQKAEFSHRMIRVRNGQLQWVAEDGRGFRKIDTMPFDIRLLFTRIPLEFHHDANVPKLWSANTANHCKIPTAAL